MKIASKTICRFCDRPAADHTKGVFSVGRVTTTIAKIWKNQESHYNEIIESYKYTWGFHNFLPKDNILYLEHLAEQEKKK